jgi:predicted nucleic acid-binding protein
MIFCDTSYLVRLYLEDPGWETVRKLCASDEVAAAELALAEIPAALHRACREGRLVPEAFRELLDQFHDDCQEQAFFWKPLTADMYLQLQEDFTSLPSDCFLQSADALHLACARGHGFTTIYSNDRHMLAAARYVGLKGVNILS